MYCGDNYNSQTGQYYGCSDGYNYYYGNCCDTGEAAWINALIWTSVALLYCLYFMLIFCGVRRRRRRLAGNRAQYRNMSTESYDSYYGEAPRYEDTRRVNHGPPARSHSPNN